MMPLRQELTRKKPMKSIILVLLLVLFSCKDKQNAVNMTVKRAEMERKQRQLVRRQVKAVRAQTIKIKFLKDYQDDGDLIGAFVIGCEGDVLTAEQAINEEPCDDQ